MKCSDEIGGAENLTNDALHLFRRAVGRWGRTSISSPYRFACGGNRQPRLQSEVLCFNVGERLLSQAEVHVGLEEQISVDVVAVINGDLVEGWYGLLLHLTNSKSLDLGELPVVSKTEDGSPIFSWCFVDGV